MHIIGITLSSAETEKTGRTETQTINRLCYGNEKQWGETKRKEK
jgi:hypothetical protein